MVQGKYLGVYMKARGAQAAWPGGRGACSAQAGQGQMAQNGAVLSGTSFAARSFLREHLQGQPDCHCQAAEQGFWGLSS